MKNKEILVQLIMKLRGVGVTNNILLNIIEKNPPHYYVNLMEETSKIRLTSYDDLINIIKVFDYCLKKNTKVNNFLIGNIKSGWSVLLASQFSKRVYALCSSIEHKNKLEKIYDYYNIKNIFLTVGICVSSWKRVAPFDIIVACNTTNNMPNNLINMLSNNGMLFIPFNIKKSIKYVKLDKFNGITETSIDYKSIISSNVL